jgi:L-asparaginase II
MEHFGFDLREIALMCSSHSGTDEHVRVVTSIQKKVGLKEEDLLCGTHDPIDQETADRLKMDRLKPTARRHNCSGKHSGMLALAKMIGASTEDYVCFDHPVQQRILKTISEFSGIAPENINVGIDGCSVPTFALPLRSAAWAFARLADPTSFSGRRAEACRTVWNAMTSHPDMVAGPNRFDTALMQVAEGVLLTKGGAEGYQGIAIAPGLIGPGTPALGVALKIADGDGGSRGRSIVALQVLKDLNVLSTENLDQLAEYESRNYTNYRNIQVGEFRPCFQLQFLET